MYEQELIIGKESRVSNTEEGLSVILLDMLTCLHVHIHNNKNVVTAHRYEMMKAIFTFIVYYKLQRFTKGIL